MINLSLYSSVLMTHALLIDLSKIVTDWKRSIRSLGGFWQGSFTLQPGQGNLSLADLVNLFYNTLGYHLEEKSGGAVTWEGMVYEMELSIGGITRRRSLSLLANLVRATYTDLDDAVQVTAAVSSTESIAHYGQREEMLSLDGFAQAAAEARRDTWLLENTWPWARTIGQSNDINLTVNVCGYVFTTNWRFLSAGDGSMDDLDDWMGEIITAECPFVSHANLMTNTLQVKKSANLSARAWDTMVDLVALGDASGNPTRLRMMTGRALVYELIPTTPAYFMRGGKLVYSAGGTVKVNPWALQPGVIRDLDFPISFNEKGGWLSDPRDFYTNEIEVSMSDPEHPSLQTDQIDESSILAAQQQYQKQLEEKKKP